MKRVDLVSAPMAGHLHPVLGIAVRLAQEPGIEVRVISTAAAQPAIAAAGVTGVAVVAQADELLETVVNPPHRVGSSPRKLLRQFRATVRLQQGLQTALLALWSTGAPDLVIADFTVPAAGPAAERHDVPWWTTHPSPCVIEARTGPPAYLGGWRPGRSVVGRGRDAVGRRFTRGFKHTAAALSGRRLSELGLPSVYRPDGSERIYSPERVFALTPEAIEYPRDLPAAVRFVGPVLYTPPAAHPAPVLTAGQRHVLVTAGTQVPWHKAALVRHVSDAARGLPGVELHVSLGGSDVDVPPAEGVVVHPYVDYARDLPRFDAVVHHGGGGVLGHTLAAGLPAVVHPVDYDQFDHAARLVDAGVAVRLLRPEGLAQRVREVLDDPSYRTRARHVAAGIHRRPAVDAVAEEVRRRLGV